jgi:hypothetical protein
MEAAAAGVPVFEGEGLGSFGHAVNKPARIKTAPAPIAGTLRFPLNGPLLRCGPVFKRNLFIKPPDIGMHRIFSRILPLRARSKQTAPFRGAYKRKNRAAASVKLPTEN